MDKKIAFLSKTRTFLSDPKLLNGSVHTQTGMQAGRQTGRRVIHLFMSCVFSRYTMSSSCHRRRRVSSTAWVTSSRGRRLWWRSTWSTWMAAMERHAHNSTTGSTHCLRHRSVPAQDGSRKQSITWLTGVSDIFMGFPLTLPIIYVLNGRKLGPSDVLGRSHYPL